MKNSNLTLWNKFGCFLTGWDARTLNECTIASRKQLSKYTSALMILIVIWSITGFCFAKRYIELPIWGCCLVSLAFVTIIIMVERQIILAKNKKKGVLMFRFIIALLMAGVGSTIFDQTMFGNDIDKQMMTNVEEEVQTILPTKMATINDKIASLSVQIDSLNYVNAALQEDVNKNPMITQIVTTSDTQRIVLQDGTIKTVVNPIVTKSQVPNPKIDVISSNKELISSLITEKNKWDEKKLSVEEETRKECLNNVGFLQELEAMFQIITSHKIAGFFYGVFFLLLLSLEMFVVVSKFGDDECDYEILIKRIESIRIKQSESMANGVLNAFPA